ncbi:hypothetical protein K7I13_12015 [Brucepastera parasyntrophica]|uniref:hypothetical protein n=1 Tax=Brucepastera parasyntrophica TaxID=2880008 RepID=UPI002109678D|nr:hypothetical protein [Brucepastera parasyntrophica]ULQ59213.1 hypothetical protein K7I13_12015 [Brucepastera parasyntrophica]
METIFDEYRAAKASYNAAEKEVVRAEKKYVDTLGLGYDASEIADIEDDSLFSKANSDFIAKNETLIHNREAAWNDFLETENRLIEYGLSIIPENLAEELRHNLKNAAARGRMVETILKFEKAA